jgi:hypothetical protein
MGSVNCVRHHPARGGVAMTIPADFNAHTTCFACHTPRANRTGATFLRAALVIN